MEFFNLTCGTYSMWLNRDHISAVTSCPSLLYPAGSTTVQTKVITKGGNEFLVDQTVEEIMEMING